MYELRVKDEYKLMYRPEKRCITCDKYIIKMAGGYTPSEVIYPITDGFKGSRVWKKHFDIVDVSIPKEDMVLDTISVGFGAGMPDVDTALTTNSTEKPKKTPVKRRKAVNRTKVAKKK